MPADWWTTNGDGVMTHVATGRRFAFGARLERPKLESVRDGDMIRVRVSFEPNVSMVELSPNSAECAKDPE